MSSYISANDVLWLLCGDHIHVSGAARGYLFQGYVALWLALKTSAHSPPPFLHLPLTQCTTPAVAALPVGGTQESNFAEHEVSQPAKIQLG